MQCLHVLNTNSAYFVMHVYLYEDMFKATKIFRAFLKFWHMILV